MGKSSRELSIVVPLHNEEGNSVALFEEIDARGLVPLVYLKLRRNFGQTAALDAGILIQLFALGLVGHILSRTYYQTMRDRSCNIELVQRNAGRKRAEAPGSKSPVRKE